MSGSNKRWRGLLDEREGEMDDIHKRKKVKLNKRKDESLEEDNISDHEIDKDDISRDRCECGKRLNIMTCTRGLNINREYKSCPDGKRCKYNTFFWLDGKPPITSGDEIKKSTEQIMDLINTNNDMMQKNIKYILEKLDELCEKLKIN